MEKLKLKYNQIIKALNQLEKSIINFENFDNYPDEINFIEKEDLYLALRESMIQRFEFNVDLLWKYIKRYIEKKMGKIVEFNSPKSAIREACRIKLISEQDSEAMLDMIDDRNMTSHIYKEKIAKEISSKIPGYYQLIEKYIKTLKPTK